MANFNTRHGYRATLNPVNPSFEIAPNPFVSHTTLGYTLPSQAQVKITILNVVGRLFPFCVMNLRKKEPYSFDFSPEENPSANGFYIVRMEIDGQLYFLKLIHQQ